MSARVDGGGAIAGNGAQPDDRGWGRLELDEGVLLRAIGAADAPGVLSVHGDSRVYRFDPLERHADVAQSERFIAPMIEHWRKHRFGYWTVLVPRAWWPDGVAGPDRHDGDRVHAGLGGLHHHIVADRAVLNVYFRLAPAVHRRGIARRIVSQGIRMARSVAPGLDIVVRTRPANAAARGVATRCGFVDEGLEPGTTDMQLLRLSAGSGTPQRIPVE